MKIPAMPWAKGVWRNIGDDSEFGCSVLSLMIGIADVMNAVEVDLAAPPLLFAILEKRILETEHVR